jgi:hypothetical protein
VASFLLPCSLGGYSQTQDEVLFKEGLDGAEEVEVVVVGLTILPRPMTGSRRENRHRPRRHRGEQVQVEGVGSQVSGPVLWVVLRLGMRWAIGGVRIGAMERGVLGMLGVGVVREARRFLLGPVKAPALAEQVGGNDGSLKRGNHTRRLSNNSMAIMKLGAL